MQGETIRRGKDWPREESNTRVQTLSSYTCSETDGLNINRRRSMRTEDKERRENKSRVSYSSHRQVLAVKIAIREVAVPV